MILVHLWWWFRHIVGVDNGSTGWYLWWSGIFGDATIFGVAVTYFLHQNCHVKGCPRIGKHSVNGTSYKVCKKHHPDMPDEDITYEHIVKAHKEAK